MHSIGFSARTVRFAALLVCAALGSAGAQPADELPIELQPVPAKEAKELVLEGVVEFGYKDESGRFVVDLLERDSAYLGVLVRTPEGRPVVGAQAKVSIDGSSSVLPGELTSDEDGIINIEVIGGQMGLDTVTARVAESNVEFALNVISLASTGFPVLEQVEGSIPWAELMQAQLEYKDMKMYASFPDSIKDLAGDTVKLSGFMMPLDPEMKQKRFILTSNPPSCFFHVPGGPAGSVEVLAAEGIEMSWDPIVIEGRFEPQETSEVGVVYRLQEAKLVRP